MLCKIKKSLYICTLVFNDNRRGGRVAEGNGLLNRRSVLNATEGSNPSFSAKSPFS